VSFVFDQSSTLWFKILSSFYVSFLFILLLILGGFEQKEERVD